MSCASLMMGMVAVVRVVSLLSVVTAAALVGGCQAQLQCESTDAGPPDAGQDACVDEEGVERTTDDALEPGHVIDHIDDLLP